LKTAQSGYLTRRLVDASQNVIVSEEDCGTVNYKYVSQSDTNEVFRETFEEKIYGKYTAKDVLK
jgi:DNA-directed RNA polymerase subunit beta'